MGVAMLSLVPGLWIVSCLCTYVLDSEYRKESASAGRVESPREERGPDVPV